MRTMKFAPKEWRCFVTGDSNGIRKQINKKKDESKSISKETICRLQDR